MKMLLAELKEVLSEDDRLFADDTLLKNKAIERALDHDEQLLELLVSNEKLKQHFFSEAGEHLVFDEEKFAQFVNNKQFLPDSYTAFKNKVGLKQGSEHLQEQREIELAWPYKDCVLEGGQTKEDEEREEKFWNKTLAPDQVDKLLDPKVLRDFKRYTGNEKEDVDEISEDDNLFIRGNNLLALNSIVDRYAGEIKLIYIDPPYNTDSDSFRYNDSFNESTWLTFMRNRLEVAKKLLSDDGAIFVQIDNHEQAYLESLMYEIFGKDNFVNKIAVETRAPSGFKMVNPGVFSTAEYILSFAKNKKEWEYHPQYVEAEHDTNYNKIVVNKDDSPSKWQINSLRDHVAKEELDYSSQSDARNELGKEGFDYQVAEFAIDNADKVFRHAAIDESGAGKETVKTKKISEDDEEVYVVERDEYDDRYIHKGKEIVFYEKKVREIDGTKVPTKPLTDMWTDIAWEGIANEGGVRLKKGKKPEKLLRRIIDMSTEEGDIVLDFFLGSGTTAAVAHKMNRQYIGIEQIDYGESDPTVRLKNVIDGDATGISDFVDWEGGGDFVYAELMQWNAEFIERIDRAENSEQLKEIWSDMKDQAFLSYRIDMEALEENEEEFEELELENQKEFLKEILDVNQLYVNYSEIEDSDYEIDEKTIELNNQFYTGDYSG